jgi:hypothetical protein
MNKHSSMIPHLETPGKIYICIYIITIDSLLTIKTLGSLGVKTHDFQSKGYGLLAMYCFFLFRKLLLLFYLLSFTLFQCKLATQIFYKYFENSGLLYLPLLTIKYLFVEIWCHCFMVLFFSACVDSRMVVTKENVYYFKKTDK